MNRILFLCVVVMGVSFSSILKAETVLYCESELATGIFKDGENRKTGKFKLERFTIKFNDDLTILKGALPDGQIMKCSKPYGSIEPEFISCIEERYPWQPFLYNQKSKRFIFAYISSQGYVKPGNDTDEIYGGKCESF